MKVPKAPLPYDIYERHKKVGSFIQDSDTVLDVGGELNHLSQFCQPAKIIVANLSGGDVIITKDKLPFKNNSFSIVCAIDVLEHIPKKEREKFLKELLRVASKKIILSFPIGTEKHVQYEKVIQESLKKLGENVTYLKEHIKYGLPTQKEILDLTKNLKSKIFYSGNLDVTKFLFKIHLVDPRVKYLRKLIYLVKNIFHLFANPIFYTFLANRQYSQNIVRAYLIIEK